MDKLITNKHCTIKSSWVCYINAPRDHATRTNLFIHQELINEWSVDEMWCWVDGILERLRNHDDNGNKNPTNLQI